MFFFMSDLNPFIFSATRAVESDVGGVSVPPRPTFARSLHSDFNPFNCFRTASTSLVNSDSHVHLPPVPTAPVFSVPKLSHKHYSPAFPSSTSASKLTPSISRFSQLDFPVRPSSRADPPCANPPCVLDSPAPALRSVTHPAGVFTNYPVAPPRLVKPRKPKAGCEVSNNTLRPHVAAADRLFTWDTPFGLQQRSRLQDLIPQPLVEPVLMTIRGALAPNTKSSYAAGILRWTQFCDKYSIDETSRMPASFALICGFIAEHKGLQSGGTIKGWLSGIRSWHLVNHAPWHGEDDPWVDFARASANKEGTRHKKAPRAPVSVEHLACLRRSISMSNPFHAAVWAVALCTFWGCRRLGETTVTTDAAFDGTYHVLRSTSCVSVLFPAQFTASDIHF